MVPRGVKQDRDSLCNFLYGLVLEDMLGILRLMTTIYTGHIYLFGFSDDNLHKISLSS